MLLVKNCLTHLQNPRLSLKEVQKKSSGQCAVITDRKSLHDGITRETIQQSADTPVVLECLVIKELLADMKCQWQLADGMTKVNARQNFAERFKGHHVTTSNWCQMKRSQRQRRKQKKSDREPFRRQWVQSRRQLRHWWLWSCLRMSQVPMDETFSWTP